jgi:GTPase SAR1 family protein
MGCCAGSIRDDQDRIVSSEIEADRLKDRQVKKLLLLGAGGSGKSTLFKQMQNILGDGFTEQEKKTFKPQIYEQVIEAMNLMICKCQDIITGMDDLDDDQKNVDDFRISEECMPAAKSILGTRKDVKITPKIADDLKRLWQDAAIQNVYKMRSKICVPDSTGHFLDNLDRIASETYVPTNDDLLLVRYRTTGMTEKDFKVKGGIFKVCDVGGQRNERRKWMNFFDGVTAVIFVASLSAYDEVVFEDEKANAMKEGLSVFADQCNSPIFKATAFILFLNKSDLFEEKIARVALTVCWPEYDGTQELEPCLDFVKQKFLECNKNAEERKIYTHVTCATDTEQFRKIFNDVQHIIINWSLEKSGLI